MTVSSTKGLAQADVLLPERARRHRSDLSQPASIGYGHEMNVAVGSQAAKPLVRFSGVEKSFDSKSLVVRDLNLDIARGEFLTLLGPSGSGKTTTLMMLAGFETPTAGTIMLDGRAIDRVPPHKRELGMVFQSYALFPHMTVEENIAFPLQVRGIKGDDAKARVQRALAMVRLAEFGKRRPSQLSGGQQQRVALARALVFEPKMVLMDEPLGALDKQLREQLQTEIKELHATLGITVLYVTHDQQEALTLSDRVAVFKDGCIQQVAPPNTIYERPETSFVARFLGETNALTGTVRELDNGRCVAEIQGSIPIKAIPVKVSGIGARTTLSIRPERICINPDPAIYPNILTGQVVRTDYFGDHIRTMLQLPGGQSLMMKLGVADHHSAVPDTTIHIGWKVEDCRALDAPDSNEQSVDDLGVRIDQ